ncbi:MAG: DUF6537 domain-containing protein, partial [Betaproteobacteria bacterium]
SFTKLESVKAIVSDRVKRLIDYQSEEYAEKYRSRVEDVLGKLEGKDVRDQLGKTFAKNLFKVMAYKDEYEVARMHSDPVFLQKVRDAFDGNFSLKFNLAPPLISSLDENGHLRKREFGSWVQGVFKVLAKLKRVRGTAFDIFGYTEERRLERRLILDYIELANEAVSALNEKNYEIVKKLLALPEEVKGFGHVKLAAIERFYDQKSALRQQLLAEGWKKAA